MKIAVAYRSMSGHSKKIAKAIAKEFGVLPIDVKTKPTIESIDLMFIVGGVYSSESLPELKQFAGDLNSKNVKKVVLITSSATRKVGQNNVRSILTANGVNVSIEEYHCLGNFLFFKMGHPNKEEINGAVQFAISQASSSTSATSRTEQTNRPQSQ